MRDAVCETKKGEELVLESVKAKGRVVGRMLDMTLEQRFKNPESTNVEVVYTFPLPWHAVLLGLEVELNGETLTGQVKAKGKARADYEEALSEGNTGILVTVNPDRSYTLELGNLLQGESCVIRLHYVEILQPEQHSLRLTLPTTIAPRYGNAIHDGRYEPHCVPEVSATVEYPFAISLAIQGELVQAQIGSPSHQVAIRSMPAVGTKEGFMTEVSLAAKAWLDRDFVLVFDQLPHASLGLAAWDHFDPGLGVVMANFTPKLPSHQALPVAMKILVDCSGSMNGDSIQAARSALQRILDGLGESDRFSLSRFGNTVKHRSKAMWKGAPAALAAARRWAQQLEADLGGTEMNAAILSTLALPGGENKTVLLITDGEIQAIDTVVETARQSKHRFFVVGIGASVAEGLLRRLAEETGGSCEFVAPGEPVEPSILRLYQRMRTPAVTHSRVEWPQGCRIHAASDLPRSVFDGDDVTVFVRLHTDSAELLSQNVRLLGRVEGIQGEICLAEVQAEFIADEANTLARLAANHRYWQLKCSAQDVPAMLKKELPTLAEKYQLVTDDTSLILVKARAEGKQALDMPEIRTVKGMLAAGWGGQGSVMPSMMLLQSSGAGIMPLPSVRRQSRAAARVDTLSFGRTEDFDIDFDMNFETPAFLRKQFEDETHRDKPVWKSPPSTGLFWISLNDAGGVLDKTRPNLSLSPAGLVEGLKKNPKSVWPKTYAELSSIALSQRLVEWLELVIGQQYPEKEVVLAFLEVMSRMDFTLRQAISGALKKITGAVESDASDLQRELQECIANALRYITARTWPAGVLDYAEVGQEDAKTPVTQTTEEEPMREFTPMDAAPLNQILFGPPGTGKTYSIVTKSLEILDPSLLMQVNSDKTLDQSEKRKRLKKRFDELLKEEKRIRFTTFHQSFSYEDFVEGIRATVDDSDEGSTPNFEIKDGIFAEICNAALQSHQQNQQLGVRDDAVVWKISIGEINGASDTRDYCFEHDEMRVGWPEAGDLSTNGYLSNSAFSPHNKNALWSFSEGAQIGDIVLCFSGHSCISAVGVVSGDYRYEAQVPEPVREDFVQVRPVRWLLKNIDFSVKELNGNTALVQQTMYKLHRITWPRLQEALLAAGHVLSGAQAKSSVPALPYVLVIDEINRGNVSRIFGELITLLEPSKRAGAAEALSVTLPYSKRPFSVPRNVYIIGTMNTTDRSLAGLDVALRRRFVFEELMPDPQALQGVVVSDDATGVSVDIARLLSVMNERIEALLDREHQLGHAYFMPLCETPTGQRLEMLAMIFKNQILPLLQEYFFDDWERIAWVLNDHRKSSKVPPFVQKHGRSLDVLFGTNHGVHAVDKRWCINPKAFESLASFAEVIEIGSVPAVLDVLDVLDVPEHKPALMDGGN